MNLTTPALLPVHDVRGFSRNFLSLPSGTVQGSLSPGCQALGCGRKRFDRATTLLEKGRMERVRSKTAAGPGWDPACWSGPGWLKKSFVARIGDLTIAATEAFVADALKELLGDPTWQGAFTFRMGSTEVAPASPRAGGRGGCLALERPWIRLAAMAITKRHSWCSPSAGVTRVDGPREDGRGKVSVIAWIRSSRPVMVTSAAASPTA